VGRAIALALQGAGFTVFGTSRRPEPGGAGFARDGRSAARRAASIEVPLLSLDVRSDQSVRALIEELRARAGHLDVLVNNAGIRFLGAAEETTVEEAKQVFDTNFFGVHRVTAAALPLLREAGAGRIVNISSLSGLNALPFGALYSASKWALEAYSESLRHELKPFGIRVSVVEPGVIRSSTREAPHRPKTAIPAYERARQHAVEAITRGDATGMDAARVAGCVLRILQTASPRLRYRVGPDATWLPRLKLLSWSLYERGIRWRYALDQG